MSQRPIVAIIGRPNVGKSSLFNRLLRRRQAIVSPSAGTTRDRHYAVGYIGKQAVDLVDTAGLTRELASADFGHEMLEQVQQAVIEADLLIFVLDAKAGFTEQDHELAEIIRRATTPAVVFVNKADNPEVPIEPKLLNLGLGPTIVGSLVQRRGASELRELLETQLAKLPRTSPLVEEEPEEARLALVGRPNVGKSTLFNRLVGSQRAIVSDIPGTTRDAIDTKLTLKSGLTFIITDTAGLRRRGKIGKGTKVERYSVLRTLRAIDRANLVLLIVDGPEGLTRGDAHIASYALEQKKQLITAINKADQINQADFNVRRFPFLAKGPMVFVSAKEGKNINELLELIENSLAQKPDQSGESGKQSTKLAQ